MSESPPAGLPGPFPLPFGDDHVFRVLVDGVRDYAIFLLTPDGRVATWNAGAMHIKGYRAEEIVGRHFSTFYTQESRDSAWPEHELKRAIIDGRFEDEGWRVRKDGSRFWANVVITALRDADGSLLGFAKITRDLTERRAYEEELRRSNEGFRLLVDNVVDYAMFMLDVDGRVLTWNAGAQRMKGYAPAEIIGQSFARFYTEADRATGLPEQMLERARVHGSAHLQGPRLRKDGSRFIADVVLTALRDERGVLRGYSKITRDISQTVRVATLEAESQRVTEFLAMLGHELRNPIAPIRNAVNLLRIGGLTPEQADWSRGVIDRQTAHLARLVDDLLDVSRIASGKVRLEPATLDVALVVARGIEAARPLIDARGHQLSVTLPEAPLTLHGDLTRLVQVLSNLLNNAAKYTPDGGRIGVQAAQEGNFVAIRVTDNGVGIAPELLDKVFDLFQQGDRALDRAEGGLGIGLTLVERIVALHGGRVGAASAGPGLGSEFRVWLPLATAPAAVAPTGAPPAARDASPGAVRVLVVDDNRDAGDTLALLIESLGHSARVVNDGNSVLGAALEFRPGAIMLDIGLPGIDGFEVARRVRAEPRLRGVRLVAVTGYGQPSDRLRATAAGFDDYFVKPVLLDQILALIAGLANPPAATVAAPATRSA